MKNPDALVLGEIEEHAVDIAREAGSIILSRFRQPLDIEFKGEKNTDPVTAADRASEEYLIGAIGKKFPEHAILSEEKGVVGQSDSDFVWVLDPLDGTSNYMNGLPLFAVSVGVLWQNCPVAGAIFVPFSHKTTGGVYHARLGNGAFFDGEKIQASSESSGRPLSEMPVQFGSQFRITGESGKTPHELRNMGSIALELTLAACGIFKYAIFGGPKLWDVAAGVILVKEAGGEVFTRSQKSWVPLERFQARKQADEEYLKLLCDWSAPIIAGTAGSTGKLVRDIHVRRSPLSFIKRLVRKRRGSKQKRQGEKVS